MIRAIILAAMVVGCGHSATTPAPPAPGELDTCSRDEDCTLVDACCGCNMGGRRVAIRKDAVAAHESAREHQCAGSRCKGGISAHSSCDAEAVCGDGHCKIMSHLGH
jgi:hypothetical protein